MLCSCYRLRGTVNNLICAKDQIQGGKIGRYSYRSATNGSTFVARRAGIQHASSATEASVNDTATNVSASVALPLKSKLLITRVKANEAPSPITTPTKAS